MARVKRERVQITYGRSASGNRSARLPLHILTLQVQVDSELVREHGYSWTCIVKSMGTVLGKWQKREPLPADWYTWHNGDLETIEQALIDHLDLSKIKNALEST